MMADETHLAGATPGDDTSGLINLSLVTRVDRNAAEAQTISLAYNQYIFEARRKKRGTTWLTDDFILAVHRSMFGSIWAWGGQYRKERLNMGCEPHLIREQLKLLSDDFLAWDSTESHMPVIEVAARLQNRLTKIHPFRNGNGRHARLVTDIFLHSRKHPLPQWPQIHLMAQGEEVRARYIGAMKRADQGDFSGLIEFMASCFPSPS